MIFNPYILFIVVFYIECGAIHGFYTPV
ncbi:hypothetical protein S96127_0424 [Yersinia pestis]|nr:hypothetical protein S96127_0424 [Yersinia pestis]